MAELVVAVVVVEMSLSELCFRAVILSTFCLLWDLEAQIRLAIT